MKIKDDFNDDNEADSAFRLMTKISEIETNNSSQNALLCNKHLTSTCRQKAKRSKAEASVKNTGKTGLELVSPQPKKNNNARPDKKYINRPCP